MIEESSRPVQLAPFASENGLQRFVEQQAKELLGVTVIASSRRGGQCFRKIDILAEAADGQPWIIECKHDLVDHAAWRQLQRYREALVKGWSAVAPRFSRTARPEPLLVAIGYRFDGIIDPALVRIAFRYHGLTNTDQLLQVQEPASVSLVTLSGVDTGPQTAHPTVSKKLATVERLARLAPDLALGFWQVDEALQRLPGVKATYGGKNHVRYSTARGVFAKAVIHRGAIEWSAPMAREMRANADVPGILDLLRQSHGNAG